MFPSGFSRLQTARTEPSATGRSWSHDVALGITTGQPGAGTPVELSMARTAGAVRCGIRTHNPPRGPGAVSTTWSESSRADPAIGRLADAGPGGIVGALEAGVTGPIDGAGSVLGGAEATGGGADDGEADGFAQAARRHRPMSGDRIDRVAASGENGECMLTSSGRYVAETFGSSPCCSAVGKVTVPQRPRPLQESGPSDASAPRTE